MIPAREWSTRLADLPIPGDVELVQGREGDPTLRVRKVFLHSRYRPSEEAVRFIDSAKLDMTRPVMVVGLGLGYHVQELVRRGVKVVVVEPEAAVVKLAVEHILADSDVLVGCGDVDDVARSKQFEEFVRQVPQVIIHPPTAHLHPEYCDYLLKTVSKMALDTKRLRIAIVGPMYGGSLPITGYLERAFRSLGHVTRCISNDQAWGLYQEATEGVKVKSSSAQLGNMLAHFLGEWSYARTIEFAPDLCIVMAQAPVGSTFPVRLAKEGIVTAFWYVENWRHMPYWKEVAPLYDCFFHIQPGEFEQQLSQAGCSCHAYIQTGCDPDIHKPVPLTDSERADFGCDLSFAGAGYFNRLQMFKGLTDYDFKIWGVGWAAKELAPLLRNPEERFTPELFAKIVAASKINLNLHSSTVHDGVDLHCDAINPRVFEIAACGGFQLCDPCIGLDALFDFSSELPVYRNLAELRSQIDHFLANPREREQYARNARERALRDHTYKQRASQMLDFVIEWHGARILRKGIRVQRTVTEVLERIKRDTPLGAYLGSLPPDLLFTHENINEQLVTTTHALTYPEKVFAYLREMRNFAETLLALK